MALPKTVEHLSAWVRRQNKDISDMLNHMGKLEQEIERLTAAQGWQDISTAPKDGTRVLVQLRSPIPNDRDDLRIWDGIPFVARHNGVAKDGFDIGWQFAAPVGCGGWPDGWLAGWQPIPAPPVTRQDGKDGAV